jgi:hypothetical protein
MFHLLVLPVPDDVFCCVQRLVSLWRIRRRPTLLNQALTWRFDLRSRVRGWRGGVRGRGGDGGGVVVEVTAHLRFKVTSL